MMLATEYLKVLLQNFMEMATHSSILEQRSLTGDSPWGCKESDMS